METTVNIQNLSKEERAKLLAEVTKRRETKSHPAPRDLRKFASRTDAQRRGTPTDSSC